MPTQQMPPSTMAQTLLLHEYNVYSYAEGSGRMRVPLLDIPEFLTKFPGAQLWNTEAEMIEELKL
jgi:hypothetical protein